ncbi:MAG: hypothetical protein JXQ68_03675 [Campylobacterales bacterium]|nr:hypothetical protein [Campylobacterales bacterium]
MAERKKPTTSRTKKEEILEEIEEEIDEAQASFTEKINDAAEKTVSFFDPITQKVREIVLGIGEIIVTISAIVGIAAAIIGGFSDMGKIGFFAGLSSMFKGIVGVIMGALFIFLLFAIKEALEKKK